jgi:hypothetical protein
MSVQLLYEGLTGVSGPQHVTLLPRLIARGSTRAVATGGPAPGTSGEGHS